MTLSCNELRISQESGCRQWHWQCHWWEGSSHHPSIPLIFSHNSNKPHYPRSHTCYEGSIGTSQFPQIISSSSSSIFETKLNETWKSKGWPAVLKIIISSCLQQTGLLLESRWAMQHSLPVMRRKADTGTTNLAWLVQAPAPWSVDRWLSLQIEDGVW